MWSYRPHWHVGEIDTLLFSLCLYKFKNTLYDLYQAPTPLWIKKMNALFECKLDKSNRYLFVFFFKKDTTLVLRKSLRLYKKYVHFDNEPLSKELWVMHVCTSTITNALLMNIFIIFVDDHHYSLKTKYISIAQSSLRHNHSKTIWCSFSKYVVGN